MNCEIVTCKSYARDKTDKSLLGYIYYYNIHVVVYKNIMIVMFVCIVVSYNNYYGL